MTITTDLTKPKTLNMQEEHNKILLQKKEITESLKYASYIQKALLPSLSLFKKIFPENFVIYQPREIVSGDFYWFIRKKNKIFLAIADCTGHGVPGAFMSILGITFLNEVILKGNFTSTGSILNQMRERVMRALNQTGQDDEMKDGIDIALCIINTDTNELEFSGAFSPIYVVQKNKLVEINGDKMPIGIAAYEERAFTTKHLQLNNDDMIYLFTDGFVDQFGGPDGKKFKYQPFRNLILRISSLPIHKQREELINSFNKWRGKRPQLDDVSIFGIRFHVNN